MGYKKKLLCWISILLMISACPLKAELTAEQDGRSELSPKPKGTVKMITADGVDVIDCADIHKQPSLDHPLLRNHTIQMKSTSYPIDLNRENNTSSVVYQPWSKYGKCPKGTVPIRRPYKEEFTLPKIQESLAFKKITQKLAGVCLHHELQDMFGVSATINVWNPATEAKDYSACRIGISYSEGDRVIESVGLGWMVNPSKFQDNHTRLIIYYQNENHPFLCFNTDYPGFVQVSEDIVPGERIEPISSYGGPQYGVDVVVYQNRTTKDWWFQFDEVKMGFLPSYMLPRLSSGGTYIYWEGEVVEDSSSSHPTTTDMGSGHYPREGFGKASFMRKLSYLDVNHREIYPDLKSYCSIQTDKGYLHSPLVKTKHVGRQFYYGGPGKS